MGLKEIKGNLSQISKLAGGGMVQTRCYEGPRHYLGHWDMGLQVIVNIWGLFK